MSKKNTIIDDFLSMFSVGQENITKGDIFRAAQSKDSNINSATVGWVISIVLIAFGYLVKTGKGAHGANLYKRIK